MIKKIGKYLTLIIDKLYSDKSTEKPKKSATYNIKK